MKLQLLLQPMVFSASVHPYLKMRSQFVSLFPEQAVAHAENEQIAQTITQDNHHYHNHYLIELALDQALGANKAKAKNKAQRYRRRRFGKFHKN